MSGAATGSGPGEQHVVVVGGGIAGIEALMALADLGERRLHLHLVAAHPSFVLRPQQLGTPWGGPPLRLDLERLCRAFGARFTLGTVTGVDLRTQTVRTTAGTTIEYDRLLVATGAQLSMAYAATRTLGFGPLPAALRTDRAASVAIVVPPGTSWTLPAYALAVLAAGPGRDVRVLTAESTPLEAFGANTRTATARALAAAGVDVQTRTRPLAGSAVAELADIVVALPLLNGPRIAGLPADADGYIPVDEQLAVPGVAHVYAAGDVTSGQLKQGGLAAQQGDTAAAQIVRSCGSDVSRVPYAPVLRGKLTLPGGEALYLTRAVDGEDEGRSSDQRLWEPPSVVCAWRLAGWLTLRRGDLQAFTLDHVARHPDADAFAADAGAPRTTAG